jgi:hypothetical protein
MQQLPLPNVRTSILVACLNFKLSPLGHHCGDVDFGPESSIWGYSDSLL